MSSTSKSKQETIQVSQKEEEYTSKKSKIHPHPEEEFNKSANSKRPKTGTKSVSKSKISTTKKSEVTFSEKVEEIKDFDQDKENEGSSLTPFKAKSPSHASLKSVKEHQKTPYSKLKENNEEVSGNSLEGSQSPSTKANQPNFNMDVSFSNSSAKKSAGRGRDVTPTKSARKYQEGKSRSKSPLTKIREVKEEHLPDKENSQEVQKQKDAISEIHQQRQPHFEEKVAEENKNENLNGSKRKISQNNEEILNEEKKTVEEIHNTQEKPIPTSEIKSGLASAGKKTPPASAQKNPFIPESNKSGKKSSMASAGKKSLTSKVPLSEMSEENHANKQEEKIDA
jgi:hypothetical protein